MSVGTCAKGNLRTTQKRCMELEPTGACRSFRYHEANYSRPAHRVWTIMPMMSSLLSPVTTPFRGVPDQSSNNTLGCGSEKNSSRCDRSGPNGLCLAEEIGYVPLSDYTDLILSATQSSEPFELPAIPLIA
ncbi:hypothetical protein L1887_44343 [Cichorium endivia]|nr:hypothetical protein L1887_44343 [Cichorium endivia]